MASTCFASHAVLSKNAAERIEASALEKVCLLDTVDVAPEKRKACGKFEIISVADEIADIIRDMHFN